MDKFVLFVFVPLPHSLDDFEANPGIMCPICISIWFSETGVPNLWAVDFYVACLGPGLHSKR